MIAYVKGDATRPRGDGPRVVAHIVNDEGKWGSGFVVALSRRDRFPELCYRDWHRRGDWYDADWGRQPFELGQTQVISLEEHPLFAANMIAQHGIRHSPNAPRAVQYDALETCLKRLADFCLIHGYDDRASVHMPRIGCGLGGGSWDEIEPIIQKTLTDRGVAVTVYDL